MYKKFAKLVYSENTDSIPLKYNLLKKAPDTMMEWYIKKYNPYVLEDIELVSESGFLVKLPLLNEDLNKEDMEKVKIVLYKTILALKDLNVDIVSLPKNIPYSIDNVIKTATGKYILCFFMSKIISKLIKITNKDLKKCEILIINGNNDLTETVIDNIYESLNYLTIITNPITQNFIQKDLDIFDETGLNINLSTGSRSVASDADIIINTDFNMPNYDYSYKRNSIFIDLSQNTKRLRLLAEKRDDMLIVDDIKIKIDCYYLNSELFELFFYINNSDYKNLIILGYDYEKVSKVKTAIKKLDGVIINFYLLDNIVHQAKINNFGN